MKAKTCVLCVVCVAAGFVLSGIPLSRSTGQEKLADPGRVKWEYKIIAAPTTERLDELGEDGWELVAVAMAGNQDLVATAYLKRSAR